MRFGIGDRVQISEYGLSVLYPNPKMKKNQAIARSKQLIVVGHSLDRSGVRVIVIGGSFKSQTTYSETFLEKINELHCSLFKG